MKKWTLVVLCALYLGASAPAWSGEKKFEIVMVAKHEGISWFDDMRIGLTEFHEDFKDKGVTAYQIAPEGGDPAKQVQMVEDLIAKQVDAILVVPNDPTALIPVIERARKQGIIVVSHEASSLAGVADWDMEAFVNEDFGRAIFETVAAGMNYEGDYAGFVGALTMETHMQWYNAGKAMIDEKYPKMRMVTEQPLEDWNTEKIALDKTNELLATYPTIKGLFGCSASSSAMISLACERRRRADIACSGIGTPSQNGAYLESGYSRAVYAWRPADAGYVCALIAYKMLMGEEIKDGVNLAKTGYESIRIQDGIIYGDAMLTLTKDNYMDYDY
ncbi:MAG: substrate-binding domain-containing protein [Planctomycetota bacterium]|jgi:simple sugar transport system substrate-binding protein|nr:substrate-binding domain-containing protein [Planctomycetota bacterium]